MAKKLTPLQKAVNAAARKAAREKAKGVKQPRTKKGRAAAFEAGRDAAIAKNTKGTQRS
jgi:hypothetical protein